MLIQLYRKDIFYETQQNLNGDKSARIRALSSDYLSSSKSFKLELSKILMELSKRNIKGEL